MNVLSHVYTNFKPVSQFAIKTSTLLASNQKVIKKVGLFLVFAYAKASSEQSFVNNSILQDVLQQEAR